MRSKEPWGGPFQNTWKPVRLRRPLFFMPYPLTKASFVRVMA